MNGSKGTKLNLMQFLVLTSLQTPNYVAISTTVTMRGNFGSDFSLVIWKIFEDYHFKCIPLVLCTSMITPHTSVPPMGFLVQNANIQLTIISCSYIYVTGFWRTNQNVTLGLFHFIDPANSYTHALRTHSQ